MWESNVSKQKAKKQKKRKKKKRSKNKTEKRDIVVYKFTIKPFIDADMPQSFVAAAAAAVVSSLYLFFCVRVCVCRVLNTGYRNKYENGFASTSKISFQ